MVATDLTDLASERGGGYVGVCSYDLFDTPAGSDPVPHHIDTFAAVNTNRWWSSSG